MPRHLLFSLLILAFTACGEIELPADDKAGSGTENTQKPEDNNGKPDKDDEKPDDGDEKPDKDDEKPDDGDEKPDKDDEKPDDGDEKPDDGDEKPDDGKGDNAGGGGTASDEVCIEGTNSVITASGHLLIEGQFYFALHDYYPVMSAYAAPELLAEYVATYTEGDLKNWRIPTEDEARFMKEIFATTSIADKTSPTYWLNIALANIQADLLDTSMRYLCEDGTKTFRFYPNTNITKAGSKTKYRLRLVHGGHHG